MGKISVRIDKQYLSKLSVVIPRGLLPITASLDLIIFKDIGHLQVDFGQPERRPSGGFAQLMEAGEFKLCYKWNIL